MRSTERRHPRQFADANVDANSSTPGTFLAKLDDYTFLLALTDPQARGRVALALTDPLPVQHGGIQLEVDIDNVTADQAAALIQTATAP